MQGSSIGDRLILLRGKKSRREVAEAIGVGVSTITMYELGKRIPKDDIKIRLARFYEKSIEEIFFR